jgi:gamma-glutamyltranspeptidase/glutathione hydrolase
MSFQGKLHRAVLGKRGMVAAAHPLAAYEGAKALEQGANAMDACLVMAGVTGVVLPAMCGLGGDVFLLYYDHKKRTVTGLNGSGTAGNGATLEYFISRKHAILPQEGICSVAVPGAPLAYEDASKRWGTWSLRQCFNPGIRIAQEGFPLTPFLHLFTEMEKDKLCRYQEGAKIFLVNGKTPRLGAIMRQPDLARTMAEFADGGAEYFYNGPFAKAFYALNEAMGGLFTGDEFKEHKSEIYAPLQTDYRGFTVYGTRPVSQGFVLQEGLNIIQSAPIGEMDPQGAESIHIMVEALKLAFDDRNQYAGDPRMTGFDVNILLSTAWAQAKFKEIDPKNAKKQQYVPLNPSDGDTTSFVAVDAEGNACSFIQSVAFAYGSGVVVPGTGVVLNNRAGRAFNLVPGHPNCIALGKRPMHTLNCYMVFKGNDLFLAGGTPGGDAQPQWNMQIISLMIDHGYGPQEAVDFPRWRSFPGTDLKDVGKPYEVRLEAGFPANTFIDLARLGHKVVKLDAWQGGGDVQIIMVDRETGLLVGGSDHRHEGQAIGI